jgi:hypothetical protein
MTLGLWRPVGLVTNQSSLYMQHYPAGHQRRDRSGSAGPIPAISSKLAYRPQSVESVCRHRRNLRVGHQLDILQEYVLSALVLDASPRPFMNSASVSLPQYRVVIPYRLP